MCVCVCVCFNESVLPLTITIVKGFTQNKYILHISMPFIDTISTFVIEDGPGPTPVDNISQGGNIHYGYTFGFGATCDTAGHPSHPALQ